MESQRQCNDCGNTERFYYPIEGIEEMQLHPETGELLSFEILDTDYQGPTRCSECDGTDISGEVQ